MNKSGLIISGICELVSIIGFLYYYGQYQYAEELTSNNIAACMVYTSYYFDQMTYTLEYCGVAIIIFLALIIYFIIK